MRAHLIVPAAVTLAAMAPALAARWETYRNPRFGFSFQYDSQALRPAPPPTNGDGRLFQSRSVRSRLEVRAYAGHNSLNHTPRQELEMVLEGLKERSGRAPVEVTYRKEMAGGFAVSGYFKQAPRRVFYVRCLMKEGIITTLSAEYPAHEKRRVDPMVERMVRTLTAGRPD